MKRRTIITTAALAPLAACAGQTPSQIAADVVSDSQLIATGLSKELPVINNLTGIPSATLAKFLADLNSVITIAQSITAEAAAVQAAPLIQQIAGYIGNALSIATTAPVNALLPPGVLPVLEAANALLPVLMAAVGLVGSPEVPASMTPAAARAILASA